jgi:hypothetical protein
VKGMYRCAILVLISSLTLVTIGCGEKNPSEADLAQAEAEKKEALAKAEAEKKEIASFRKTARFTLLCRGRYALTVKGETSEGYQSFGITIDPEQYVAHYFDFDANGSYDIGQRDKNNEVLDIKSVDPEWVEIYDYRFNRSTLKYEFSGGVASGTCVPSQPAQEIPMRKF